MALTGHCLCGAVRFEAEAPREVGVCHCSQCRRWASGPYFAVAAASVRFEGEENIGRHRSSERAERGFCRKCGTSLFYHLLGKDRYMMAQGSFDDQQGWHLVRQVFIEDKPDFYSLAQDTRTSVGDDFFVRGARPKGG